MDRPNLLKRRRASEMLEFAGIYYNENNQSPVVAQPLSWAQLPHTLEQFERRGSQGRYRRFIGTGSYAGVKEFIWPDELSVKDRRDRADILARALRILESVNIRSGRTITLLNSLNVPKRYAVDSTGSLRAIVVPNIPDTCFMPNNTDFEISIADIISAGGRIRCRTGNSDDPLPDSAKWSFLASLCETISSLHVLGLSHGDISRNNVFVRWSESDNPKAYIIDAFNGLSVDGKTVRGELLKTLPMATDVFCPFSVKRALFTEASDVYALSYWVIHIAFGRRFLPLIHLTSADVVNSSPALWYRDDYAKQVLRDHQRTIPSWLFDILAPAIFEMPENRPSSEELNYAVHDHWLNIRGR